MVKLALLMSIVSLVLAVVAVVQILGTEESLIRKLPRIAWLLLVVFFPTIGALAWFFIGRAPGAGRAAAPGPTSPFPEYDRPGRARAADPEKDAEFLRKVRERAEEQRRRYEEQKRRQQQDPDGPPAT